MTIVPPVTEEKSPPLSFTTGADSPVIADSSTVATPSITSPSFGMTSPARTITRSPFFSVEASTHCSFPSFIIRARIDVLVFFNVSTCAFPRPCVIASAKFANQMVIPKIIAMIALYRRGESSCNICGNSVNRIVAKKPISTTNSTGFFTMYMGLNFKHACQQADKTNFLEKICSFCIVVIFFTP